MLKYKNMLRRFILFAKHNKFLVIFISLMIVIAILLAGGLWYRNNQKTTPVQVTQVSKGAFTLYKEDGKYYVESREPSFTDKTIIRRTLGIPDTVDFEIVYPAAIYSPFIEGDPEQTGIGDDFNLGD